MEFVQKLVTALFRVSNSALAAAATLEAPETAETGNVAENAVPEPALTPRPSRSVGGPSSRTTVSLTSAQSSTATVLRLTRHRRGHRAQNQLASQLRATFR